ncbi:MAG: Uma2 family endonuclease [Cytophagia bacterium]|nr:MAG: Uma2 family endonuclease [Cytophagia bacterium]TAG44651.1 MAG: Uma2 family endonuclease [Cytophagia bacterium]
MQTLVSEPTLLTKYRDEDTGEIIYPSSDGNRMAESTTHFQHITTLEGNLESLFANKTDVFVAGDLLWYPEEGNPFICVAPDTMIVFGRPKGHRDSYQQWNEHNIAPAVVFEILSKSNGVMEMLKKYLFYQKYGVKEYYLYDPLKEEFYGWIRKDQQFETALIEPTFQSPLLGVTFEISQGSKLQIYNPDGTQFLTFVEQTQKRKEAEEALRKAEEATQKAEEIAKSEKIKAEQAEEIAAEAQKAAAEAKEENNLLKKLLKEKGFNLEDI